VPNPFNAPKVAAEERKSRKSISSRPSRAGCFAIGLGGILFLVAGSNRAGEEGGNVVFAKAGVLLLDWAGHDWQGRI
jgi:hypothetical protein